MLHNKEKNIIYFDNDAEFTDFCIVPKLVPIEFELDDGNKMYYAGVNYTSLYEDAIRNGTQFQIKDDNSAINKHKAVSFRTITKPVDNLIDYWGEEELEEV